MSTESTIIMESHRSAATLYATGELTADGALRAIAQVQDLPDHVRALCVDLRAVRGVDDRTLRALDIALRDWRAARRGVSRVKLPDHACARPIALAFVHKRWNATPERVTTPRTQVRLRIRDYRVGVVTRSLRECARSETR